MIGTVYAIRCSRTDCPEILEIPESYFSARMLPLLLGRTGWTLLANPLRPNGRSFRCRTCSNAPETVAVVVTAWSVDKPSEAQSQKPKAQSPKP